MFAGSMLAIAHGRSMARVTAPAVLGESALLAALAKIFVSRPLTYRRRLSHMHLWMYCACTARLVRTYQFG